MSIRTTARVRNGLLETDEPLDLPEGTTVELVVVPLTAAEATPPRTAEQVRQLDEALTRLQAEGAKYPPEWWEEFDRLQAEARALNTQFP